MKREDLKQYSAKHLIAIIDGKEESTPLNVDDPNAAYISAPMPEPNGVWAKTADYVLSDANVESLSIVKRGGREVLTGAIYLKRDGAVLKWDADAQPDLEK
jgi:hypothetical protein